MPVSGRMETSRPQTHHHSSSGHDPSATILFNHPEVSSNSNLIMHHHTLYSSSHQLQPSSNAPAMQRCFYNQHISSSTPSNNYYHQHQSSVSTMDQRRPTQSESSYNSNQINSKSSYDALTNTIASQSSRTSNSDHSMQQINPGSKMSWSTCDNSNNFKPKNEDTCSSTPSGQKLTFLMQQAMQADGLNASLESKNDTFNPSISANKDIRSLKDISSLSLPNDKNSLETLSKVPNEENALSNVVDVPSLQKNSHSIMTPGREIDSPASTEPPSLPSDRANSHCLSDCKYPESLANVLDLGDLEPLAHTSENQQTTPTSIPSQSDRNENNNVFLDKESSINDMTDSPTRSTTDATPSSTPEHSFKEQTASMLSLDVTIESVLDKIRNGRGQEVEFIPCSRQQKEQQIKLQQSKKKTSAASTPENSVGFSSHPTSPRTPVAHTPSPGGCSPAQNSKSYMHHRQRINSALEQVSSSFCMQPSNPNTSPYPPQVPQRQVQPPSSPTATYISQQSHPTSVSKPMFPPQAYTSPHPQMSRQSPHQQSPVYNMHHSPYQQYASMQRHYLPNQSAMYLGNYSVGQPPSGYNGHHQRMPLQSDSGNISRQSYYSASSVLGLNSTGSLSYMHRSPQSPGNMPPPSPGNYSPMERSNPSISSSTNYYNFEPNNSFSRSDISLQSPNTTINSAGSIQSKHSPQMNHLSHPVVSPLSSNYGCPTVQPLQQSCYQKHSSGSLMLSPIYPQGGLTQPPNQMIMMPPPSNVNHHHSLNSLTTRKRPISTCNTSVCATNGKRKKIEKHNSNIIVHNSWEDLLDRLHLENYCSILQDPMVTSSLSILPPKGGISLGKIINCKEPQKESLDVLEKPKKYSLAPYKPKLMKPKSPIKDSEANSFLVENMSKFGIPVIHNGPYLDFPQSIHRDTNTPENPVPSTPPIQMRNATDNSSTSLFAILNPTTSVNTLDRTHQCTPPIQLLYPLIVQTALPDGFMFPNTEISTTNVFNKTELSTQNKMNQPTSVSSKIIDSETGEILVPHQEHGAASIEGAEGVNNDGEKLHLTFTLNAAMAGNVPKVVRGFTDMLGIDFGAVDYEVTRSTDFLTQSTNYFSKNHSSDSSLPITRIDNPSINPSISIPLNRDLHPNFGDSVEKYNESVVTISSLLATKKQVHCKQCKLLVDEQPRILKKVTSNMDVNNLSKTTDDIFCSLTCMSLYTNTSKKEGKDDMSLDSDKNMAIECAQQLYVGVEGSAIPVLLKGPLPKHSKASLKRQLSYDRSFYRSQEISSLLPLNHAAKRWKEMLWRRYDSISMTPIRFYKDLTQGEIRKILTRHSLSLKPNSECKDLRSCRLCKGIGDAPDEGPGRMLNLDADEWLHVNCALWCFNVYETVSGALVDVDLTSYQRADTTLCVYCQHYGAGLPCYRSRCQAIYHLPCAVSAGCMFFTDRGMYCPVHKLKDHPLYLPFLSAKRRIYIERDESIQLACFSAPNDRSLSIVFRIGSLTVHKIGYLTEDMITSGHFHTETCIYPIDYRATRIHWSLTTANHRSQYHCSIEERLGHPLFVITVLKNDQTLERFEGKTCNEVWQKVLEKIAKLRADAGLIKLFPQHLQGEDLFGLTEPHVVRALECLPKADSLPNYVYRYGCMYNLHESEMPTVANLSGCARSECKSEFQPDLKVLRRTRPRFANPTASYTVNTDTAGRASAHTLYNPNSTIDQVPCTKHNLHSKMLQFRRLSENNEWRVIVKLARSNIRGLGLFAAKDIEKYTMIIEYKGEFLRNEVANTREFHYKKRNIQDVYLIRIDNDRVLDATRFGNCARYIRHSREPNCTAEGITIDGKSHIVLLANKTIDAGSEITYNYKLDTHHSLLTSFRDSQI